MNYQELEQLEKDYPLTRDQLEKHMVEFKEPVIINGGEAMETMVNGEKQTFHTIPGFRYVRNKDEIRLVALNNLE